MLLKEFATLLIFVCVVDIIYVFSRTIKYKKTERWNFKAELSKFAFISYIAALIAILIVPKITIGIDDTDGFFCYFLIPTHSYNIYPFKTILAHLSLYKNGDPIGLINLFVNSCLFIPFPLLLKLNYSNLKIRYCFFIPFGSILACECLQYFVGRASDIDDVILNTVGILFGMLFLQLINKLQMRTAHK